MKKIPWLITITAVFFLFLQRECHHCPEGKKCPTLETTVTVTKPADSALHEVKRDPKKPKPVPKAPVYNQVPKNADTPADLKHYYAYFIYEDEITEPGNFRAIITDTLFKNRLHSRKIDFQNLRPQTTKTVYIKSDPEKEEPKRKLFMGIGFGGKASVRDPLSTFAFTDISPSALYISKKDHIYQYQYNIFEEEHFVHTYWKIRFKK